MGSSPPLLVSGALLLLALVLAPACGSTGGSSAPAVVCQPGDAQVPSGTTLESESSGNACPSAPTVLRGTVQPGAPCMRDEDCAPTCCACTANGAASGKTALVASCAGGVCATVNELCCGWAKAPSCMQ